MTKKQLNKENSCMRKALEKILYRVLPKAKGEKQHDEKTAQQRKQLYAESP
nr:MAG TPA: hypothetical protein [Caudoviricetes sp.]